MEGRKKETTTAALATHEVDKFKMKLLLVKMNNLLEEQSSQSSSEVLSFLAIANEEYNALTTYCNSLSSISHAVHGRRPLKHQTLLQQQAFKGSKENSIDPNLFLLPSVTTKSQDSRVSTLKEYQKSLQNLQNVHSKLFKCCKDILKGDDQNKVMISDHFDLSTRVLKTCASSMKRGYGPLYENGLLKNLGGGGGNSSADGEEDWHEIRIVALSSYRASISKLKSIIAT